MPYACPINGVGAKLDISSITSGSHSGNSQASTSSKRPATRRSSFYIYDETDENTEKQQSEDKEQHLLEPVRMKRAHSTKRPSSTRIHSLLLDSKISKLSFNLSQILKFPKESTHAYSYSHLSPNSLAVRLSTLRRSLEILLDRPDLLSQDTANFQSPSRITSSPINIDIDNFIKEVHNESQSNEPIKRQANASSAALSILFKTSTSPKSQQSTQSGLKALIHILQDDNDNNNNSRKDLAINLHDLSLSNFDDPNSGRGSMPDVKQLRIKLLHALATPFYESIVQTPIINNIQQGASTLALSSLTNQPIPLDARANNNNNDNNSRPFHNVSQKNSPQAVFTSELNSPWGLKAANDLACLIFGVSRGSLKKLTLMDLISPDSRPFVLNRMSQHLTEGNNNDIIFSGEVIAIAKPGNKLTWASLWAKRKENLIICMFDQVPCDSVDLTIDTKDLKICAWKKISGQSIFDKIDSSKTIDQLVNNIANYITAGDEDQDHIKPIEVTSCAINRQRYFTIKKNEFNIPCAITTKFVDEKESLLKLKIHSLPYIAGVFIISNKEPSYNILSFNSSVSKNLFGLHDKDLVNQPITKIIPNFNKMMSLMINNHKNFKIVPGIVLPEHFFRQLNTVLESNNEDDFLNSIGIDAVHSDGSIIKIDIQLRCSDSSALILWITHSRTVFENKLEDPSLDEKAVAPTPISTQSALRKNESVQDDVSEEEIPSQLSILDENDIQSVSRSSSLRLSNANSASDLSTLSSLKLTNSVHDGNGLENFKVLGKNITEDQLLLVENETIEKNKSASLYYPKSIGSKRREKTFQEFKVLKNMGQGAYGNVVFAEYNRDPKNYRVVIKLIIKERILVDTWVRDRRLGTIPSEIQIMATLNNNPHPNIMRLIDFFEDNEYYYIETPQHGFPSPAIDLFDLIELKKTMTEKECKSIIRQCASAIHHLHNNGIVHRDIKDENLIIDNKGIIKLIDFGSAAYVKTGPFDVFVGTLDYAAPEVLNGQPYEGKSQDVWSLGILIYTLIYKENPFYNVDEIMEGELRTPFITSESCISLIRKILQRDIKKRVTMNDIIKDPWLQED